MLIDDLVDSYEVEVQGFLTKEGANVEKMMEAVQNAADSGQEADQLLDRLSAVLRNWDLVAQPIQVSRTSRGLPHDASLELAARLRNVAIHLHNEHGRLEDALHVTQLIQEVFAEVGEVAAWAADDVKTLQTHAEHREAASRESRKEYEQWAKEITYEAEVGLVFKNRLGISPQGILWGGRSWPLDAVTHVRWGGVRHSVNGIPTGTEYTIHFRAAGQSASVTTRKEVIYREFTSRLWKAVGVRLLKEMLEQLQQGKKLSFGAATIDDHGADIPIHKFLSSSERVYGTWSELGILEGPGYFRITSMSNKKAYADLSYLEIDNVHILEAAMQAFWKKGGRTLSSLLRGNS
jgi:hypothetical protein